MKDVNEKVMKTLVISDIHFGGPPSDRLYFELQEVFLKYLETNAHEVDLVVVNGDLFHSKLNLNELPAKLLLRFVDQLTVLCAERDVKLRFLRGTKSHDYNQMENFRHLETVNHFDFRIINKVEAEEIIPGVQILWVPEEYMQNQQEFYAPFVEGITDDTKYDMIFFHGTFDFASFPGQIQESERDITGAPVFSFKEWSEYAFGPIIGGHIHAKQDYKNKVYYCGSFTRWCYGETDSKGFLEVNYNIETLESEVFFIENELAPVFTTIDLNTIKGKDLVEKVQAIQGMINETTNLRVKIPSSFGASEVAVLKEAFSINDQISIDTSERLKSIKDDEKVDDQYMFILNRELDVPGTIQRYLKLQNHDLSLEVINEALSSTETLEEED
jgi:DNA repair exonuclease SbcCD nuclease subunit